MLFSLSKTEPKNNTFAQQTQLVESEFSVNIPMRFTFKNKIIKGWINVLDPFRGSLITGTPGSGKSTLIVNEYIRQHIEKGYTMCIYDFKSPDLSRLAYYHYLKNSEGYQKRHDKLPAFYYINFTDLRRSSRCNPFLASADVLKSPADAYQAAETILFNLNRQWLLEEFTNFFMESAVRFLACCIWYMKRYNDRQVEAFLATLPEEEREKPGVADHINYCTFPHIIEFATQPLELILPLLSADRDSKIFGEQSARLADEDLEAQREGLFGFIQIQLAALATPALYWVMTGTDALIDINNPDAPKILCLGNTPERTRSYSTPLALIAALLVNRVNRPRQIKCSLIFDELPTVYVPHLDWLIATGRSNKIASCLVFQDCEQLTFSYGQRYSSVLIDSIGTVFSGQMLGEMANITTARLDKKPIITAPMQMMLPAGHFIGEVASSSASQLTEPVFYAQFQPYQNSDAALDNKAELPLQPAFIGVSDEQMQTIVQNNMDQIKTEIKQLLNNV